MGWFIVWNRYKIIKEHNPAENTRPQSSGGRKERAAEAGLCITCVDFSTKNPSIFIAGTLCGGIYKCSLDATTPIQGPYQLKKIKINLLIFIFKKKIE